MGCDSPTSPTSTRPSFANLIKIMVTPIPHPFLIHSRQLLEELSGEDLSNETFPFSTHKVLTIAGHKVRALRLTFVGEMGWELHIPKDSCVPVYTTLMEHGKRFNICDAGIVLNFVLSISC